GPSDEAHADSFRIGGRTVVGSTNGGQPRIARPLLARVSGELARSGSPSLYSLRVTHRITLIPGDGIGPEVAGAARRVVAATGVEVAWDVQEAGAGPLREEGSPLPDRVLASIRANRTALKGPITTPVGTGFRSVNVALRQDLDLFAAVRPARSLPGVPSRHAGVDLVVIRENTEDLYAGIEFAKGSEELERLREALRSLASFEIPPDAGVTVKPISVSGTRRVVRFAFDFARRNGRRTITLGHKAN